MMLPETSAAYVVSDDTTGPTNLEVKQSWFKQIYNASREWHQHSKFLFLKFGDKILVSHIYSREHGQHSRGSTKTLDATSRS